MSNSVTIEIGDIVTAIITEQRMYSVHMAKIEGYGGYSAVLIEAAPPPHRMRRRVLLNQRVPAKVLRVTGEGMVDLAELDKEGRYSGVVRNVLVDEQTNSEMDSQCNVVSKDVASAEQVSQGAADSQTTKLDETMRQDVPEDMEIDCPERDDIERFVQEYAKCYSEQYSDEDMTSNE